ncbi:hypothetical protein SAMN02745116_02613 [Pilibacter termitis]|uniref:Barstar (barnase inhibitor) domain-containing protein n=1 Tax=Pilibacter termitis TaxID=263852 RepID=A0A1T4RI00_9ENTE|nr:barstar family protein [Pilibacter termitis]SKA15563.1 hypothetical protein SAMN02745116_02613 [Pilibacter termitis]
MIKNRIHKITLEEVSKIERQAKSEHGYIVKIDGKELATYNQYMLILAEKFVFKQDVENNVDAFLDWMRDFNNLQSKGYLSFNLIIFNWRLIFKGDKKIQEELIDDLEFIIDFWENEVEHVVVGGKKSSFQVYLVEQENVSKNLFTRSFLNDK